MKNILTKALLSTALFSTLINASDSELESAPSSSTKTVAHVVKKHGGKVQNLRSLIYQQSSNFDDEYDGVVPDPDTLLAKKFNKLDIGEDSGDEFSGSRFLPQATQKDLIQGLKRKSPTGKREQTLYEAQLIAKIKTTAKNVVVYTPDTLPKTPQEVSDGAYIVLNVSDILLSGVGETKYGFKLHLKDIVESRADIHVVVICDVDSETLSLQSLTKINNRPSFVIQHLPQMVQHVELHDPEGKITKIGSGFLSGHPKLQSVAFKGFKNLRHIESGVGVDSPSISKIDLSDLVNLEKVEDGFFAGHDAAMVDLTKLKKLVSVGSQFLKPKNLLEAARVGTNGRKMLPTQRQAVTGYDHLNDDVQMALYHSYQIPEVRRKLAEKQYEEDGGCCGCF